MENSTSIIHFNESDCKILNYVGIYCIALFIVAVTSNSIVIFVFLRYRKRLFHHINILTFALVLLNLIGSLIGLPIIILTSLTCR